MSNIEVERYLTVRDEQLDVSIRVGPDSEGFDLVQISTHDQSSHDHFGKTRLVLEREFALELAGAIMEVARSLEAKRAAQLKKDLSR